MSDEQEQLRQRFLTEQTRADLAEARLAALASLVEMFCAKYPTSQEFWVRKFRAALPAAVLPEPEETP